ncbi:hypothetical protein [Halomonas sp. C05BenzN]|uniref:hypothetical protein n=1 Tax=Halomonas sp. C05BenzN TaxID=3411041 RepID=UPI003B94A489
MTTTHRDDHASVQDLESLKRLWKALGDTPTDATGCLEEAFQHFPAGTQREEVWHWFEAQNPAFCVGELMNPGQGT